MKDTEKDYTKLPLSRMLKRTFYISQFGNYEVPSDEEKGWNLMYFLL